MDPHYPITSLFCTVIKAIIARTKHLHISIAGEK